MLWVLFNIWVWTFQIKIKGACTMVKHLIFWYSLYIYLIFCLFIWNSFGAYSDVEVYYFKVKLWEAFTIVGLLDVMQFSEDCGYYGNGWECILAQLRVVPIENKLSFFFLGNWGQCELKLSLVRQFMTNGMFTYK